MSAIKLSPKKPNKTDELIIYIAAKLQSKPNYGSVLFNKTLYFIDSVNYLKKGEPISSLSYIKQDRGATPKPSQFLPIRERLENTEQIQIITNDYFGRPQIRYIPLREANIEVFEKDELVLIDSVIDKLSGMNATEASDFNHKFLSWIAATPKEELPFYTFALTTKDPDEKDFKWAKREIDRYLKSNPAN